MLITSNKVRPYSSSELEVMYMLKLLWEGGYHLETVQKSYTTYKARYIEDKYNIYFGYL